MSTTIPALDSVTDILDTDKIMVTQQSGQTYTISGANLNKRNQAIIASSKTITGAPLKTGNVIRVYLTAELTAANASTALVFTYNGVSKTVKVPKNGSLVNYTPFLIGSTYKYCQAYTTLEMLYDGTNFIVLGNPLVLSGTGYAIYAEGPRDTFTQTYDTASDANIIPEAGKSVLHRVSTSGSHIPSAIYGWLITTTRSGNYITQIAMSNGSTSSSGAKVSITYRRNAYYSGGEWVWGAWGRLIDFNGATGLEVTDANDLTRIGLYTGNGLTHAPSTGWVNYLVIPFGANSDYASQLAWNQDGVLYLRSCSNGTWGTWKTIG